MDDLQRHAEGRRILTLTDLEHQYLVVRARLRLAQVSWEQGMLRVGATSLPDLYAALIATGLYEVSLSCSVWNVFTLVFLQSINLDALLNFDFHINNLLMLLLIHSA